MKLIRLAFERRLVPGQIYYPRLAQIHYSKQLVDELDQIPEEAARGRFAELLLAGALLEYNRDENWYDVHPIVREIGAFRHALEDD